MTARKPAQTKSRLAETVAPYVTDLRPGVTKLSISLPTPLIEAVRQVAADGGSSVSSVIAAAIRSATEGSMRPGSSPPSALVRVAELWGLPVDQLASEAVRAWLDAKGVRREVDDEWRRRFGEFLEERRAIAEAAGWSDEEVQRDVDEAVREVREARAAHRR